MLPSWQQRVSGHSVYTTVDKSSQYGYISVAMKLEEWMIANGFDDRKVAELTGLHRTFVWKLRRGKRKPSPEVMDKLVEVSHGAITRPALRPDLYPEQSPKSGVPIQTGAAAE